MAKYISVLNSQMNEAIWTAVQWAQTKQELDQNRYYTAGVNLSLPKGTDDNEVGEKTITEISSGETANVTMIKLSSSSSNFLGIADNTASKSFVRNIQKSRD